jgi:hypothetical protein
MPQKRASNDLAHDLVGPAIDTHDPSIGVSACDRKLSHESVSAMELNAEINRATLELGAPHFCHCRFFGG